MNTVDAVFTSLIHTLLKNMWVCKCGACFLHRIVFEANKMCLTQLIHQNQVNCNCVS